MVYSSKRNSTGVFIGDSNGGNAGLTIWDKIELGYDDVSCPGFEWATIYVNRKWRSEGLLLKVGKDNTENRNG
jgi:hypothetical protein